MLNLILFYGEYSVRDPMKVLIGPDALKTAANAVWEEMEANGGWHQGDMRTITPEGKRQDKNAQKISDKWNALLGIEASRIEVRWTSVAKFSSLKRP